MRSAGKTFAPVLVGWRDSRARSCSQQHVYPLFGDSSLKNPDARKKQMTLRDLMTMTAGNACDDNSDASLGNEDRMESDDQEHDWYRYTSQTTNELAFSC